MTEMNATEEQLNESLTPAEPKEQNTGAQQPETKKQKRMRIGREALILLLSFAVPAAIFAGFWAIKGITWNGELTPLIYDMNSQYMPFLASLRYILNGENSFFYNWNICLGGNYLPLFAYYIANPLNLITVFFELDEMANAVYLMTLLKIGLCGLTFAIYLRWGIAKDKVRFGNILFASCYALMSYNVMYSMCIMWLDGIILLPLILLGIEKILEGKRGGLYLASIFALFYCNYYISYMVGIFAALYIVCRVFVIVRKDNRKECFLMLVRFGINTLLALGLSMILLFPALKGYFAAVSNALKGEAASVEAYSFSVAQLLGKLLPQQYDSIEHAGLPSIYCGSIMLILFAVFFFQKQGVREKIAILIMLSLPVLGFLFEPVDYALHVFQYPHCYNYRYSFLFSAVVLIAAYHAYLRMRLEFQYAKYLIIVVLAYTYLELFMNGSVITDGLHEELQYMLRETIEADTTGFFPLIEDAKEDPGFYRICGNDTLLDYNIPMMCGTYGVQSFTSTFDYGVTYFLRSFGANNVNRISTGQGLSILMDDLLGIKYRIRMRELPEKYIVKSKLSGEKGYLYENPNAFSLGYMVDNRILGQSFFDQANPFENQNQLLSLLNVSEEKLFFEILCEIEEVSPGIYRGEFQNTDAGVAYLLINYESRETASQDAEEDISKYITILLNGVREAYLHTGLLARTAEFDSLQEENELIIQMPPTFRMTEARLYSFDWADYEACIQTLGATQLQVTEFGKNVVRGEIEAKNRDDVLLLTIPYDTGWTVKVDGEVTQAMKALGCFTAIALNEGRHEIEMTYLPEGLWMGIAIFAASFLLTILYYLFLPKFFKENVKNSCKIDKEMF